MWHRNFSRHLLYAMIAKSDVKTAIGCACFWEEDYGHWVSHAIAPATKYCFCLPEEHSWAFLFLCYPVFW